MTSAETCEKRSDRSKVSVDASGLEQAKYRARVKSGANSATSPRKIADSNNEAEFDFDSDGGDIAAGATRLDPEFIVGGRVRAALIDSNGVVVASATRRCRIR